MRALFNWVQGAEPDVKPGRSPAPARSRASRPTVYVDVSALARRHPAWHLAEALEGGHDRDGSRLAAPALSALNAFAAPRRTAAAASISLPMMPIAPRPAAPMTTAGEPPFDDPPIGGRAVDGNAVFARGARRETDPGIAVLHRLAGQRQGAALESFLDAAEARQDAARAAHAGDLRETLLEQATVSRRRALSPLPPVLPDDVVQLEMTNLRLRLENPRLTAVEKESARQRLAFLEAQWRARLREQEAQQQSKLAELRAPRPRRAHEKDEARIAALLSDLQGDDAARREAAYISHQARWGQDFGGDAAVFGIALPGFAFSPPGAAPHSPPPATMEKDRQPGVQKKPKTFSVSLPSVAGRWRDMEPLEEQTPVRSGTWRQPEVSWQGGARGAQIRALRARALREARLWAAVAARRGGWQWRESTIRQSDAKRAAQVVSGTLATLRVLNLP